MPDFELLFKIANASVLPAWLLLIVAPAAKLTRWVAYSYAYPFLLGGFYAFLLIAYFGTGEGGMGSLAEIRQGFSSDAILLLGWVHYLVFDLFVGTWEAKDARKHGISHLLVVPCLIFTLMLGPVGLMLYLIIRWIKTGSFLRTL